MAFNNNITPGAAPLLWSEVSEAFRQVNENFDILVATVGDGSGLVPVDFSTLDTNVSPVTDNLYNLGDVTHKWGSIYAGEFTTVKPLNGLWAGSAQVRGVGVTINLPAGSTVGGDPLTGIGTSLIIDPDKTFFKTVQVDDGNSVVANGFAATLNLNSGTAMQLVVDSSAESITINNTGVTSLSAGTGMSVSSSTGGVTVTNAGVRSLTSTTSLPSGRTAGAGINIDHSTGDGIKITNTGVISIISGVGITVSSDTATGEVQIINSAPAGSTFSNVLVDSDYGNLIAADSVSDTLSINAGLGITLTPNASTDAIEIAVDPSFNLTGDVLGDLTGNVLGNVTGNLLGNVTGNTEGYHTGDVKGSVFGDDSSILVDAVSNYIYGNVRATTLRTAETEIALGVQAGETNQGASAIAIGTFSGVTNQSNGAIAVGFTAGGNDQGGGALAIGYGAGNTSQATGAIALGYNAGQYVQGGSAVAIGFAAGGNAQGLSAIAIGFTAGGDGQGANSIAIGASAGTTNQPANSIIINASSSPLNGSAAGFYVAPIRSTANGSPMMYDASTKELTYSSALTFTGSTIDTSDSSGITVVVQTTFNTDVVIENDLSVTQLLTVAGSRVINLAQLQEVVAASADFTDFQARIAALV